VTSRPGINVNRIDHKGEPHLAHVDLALNSDSSGVAIGWVEGFTRVRRSDNTFELMPAINFDAIPEIKPPRGGEIEFDNIRTLFYRLREAAMPRLVPVGRQRPDSAPEGLHNRRLLDGQNIATV
jgi:hypothetical protein